MRQIINEITDGANKFLDYNLSLEQGLFVFCILDAVLIFFMLLQLIILSVNNNIWKSKRLLALYPLKQMTKNIADFSKTLANLY